VRAGPSLDIPDPGTIVATLGVNVPGRCVIEDVNLADLDITHPWAGDLSLVLEHRGTRGEMFSDVCGPDDDFDLTLDDDDPEGNGPVLDFGDACAGTGPVGAGLTWMTESGTGLNTFDGGKVTGDWLLEITDDFSGDAGTLNGWTLEIRVGDPSLTP
jgi:hypothetical protein